jgi:hypothetical protein
MRLKAPLLAILSAVQGLIARLDPWVARRLPRHYASPSYLVVATRAPVPTAP